MFNEKNPYLKTVFIKKTRNCGQLVVKKCDLKTSLNFCL